MKDVHGKVVTCLIYIHNNVREEFNATQQTFRDGYMAPRIQQHPDKCLSLSSSPATCCIFVVERLVDDAHHRLTRAPKINPD